MFRGKVVIQNTMNATRLWFNPDIREAIIFRNSIAEHGLLDVEPLAVVLDNSREGFEADFMKLHPRKNISQLEEIKEDGMFLVLGKIVDVISDGPWFYLACKCNKSVTLKSNIYFCDSCRIPVLHVHPRFKVKVLVEDGENAAVFVLFDKDMNLLIKKTCEELLTQSCEDKSKNGYPACLNSLTGHRLLFKVETRVEPVMQYDGSFPVRRICLDEDIISMFELLGADLTPSKVVFAPPFPNISSEIVDLEEPFSQPQSNVYVAPISLRDDEYGSSSRVTPAKRKLEPKFLTCELGNSSDGVISEDSVHVEKMKQPVGGLVAVKIEKE